MGYDYDDDNHDDDHDVDFYDAVDGYEGDLPDDDGEDYVSYDDSMDGDHESALRDAGWGTDEDYGFYGEDY